MHVIPGEKVKVAREGLVAWADLVLLAVSPGLLAAGWKTELEPLLAGHIRDDRCLPVLLRPLIVTQEPSPMRSFVLFSA